MQQRLSIFDLWDVLQRDPFYRDRDSVQEIVDNIIAETLIPPLTFDLNPQLKGMGCATDPVFMLIFVLCGLCRLNTYEPSKDKPTRWFGQEFANECSYKLDLEIDRDEFKDLLHQLELPLPEAWFPDDTDEPQKKADLEAVAMVPDAVTEESSVPVFCLYKKGEHWWIGEKGKEVSVNEVKGLCFIHFLLSYPYEYFRPEFVYKLGVTSGVGDVKIDYDELEAKGAFFQPRLTGRARSAYKVKITELQGRLEANDYEDPSEAYEINEEIEKLRNELIGRKIRNHTSEEEKARKNVSKAIDRALSKIHELVPSIEQYLNKHTIKKGGSCSYKPLLEDQPDWILHPKDLTS